MDSLNRTSVGLKQEHPTYEQARKREPQSNQRGIETMLNVNVGNDLVTASIEPAWD